MRLFILLFFFFFSFQVKAIPFVPSSSQTVYWCGPSSSHELTATGSTSSEACAKYCENESYSSLQYYIQNSTGWSENFISTPPVVKGSYCTFKISAISNSTKTLQVRLNYFGGFSIGTTQGKSCPENSTQDPGYLDRCNCNLGYNSSGSVCSPVTCSSGKSAGKWTTAYTTSKTVNVLDNENSTYGCQIKIDILSCVKSGSYSICSGNGFYTGQVGNSSVSTQDPLSTDSSSEQSDPPKFDKVDVPKDNSLYENINAGKCPGTVNGVSVWVPCGTVSANSGTDSGSTTQKADGSTVKTDSKSITTCEGGSCNTTTTTTNTTINPDGSTAGTETKTDTKTEPKETFCKENPTFAACVPSGFSASSCGAAPSCTGDAIQCAIAQQQHKAYCELMATPTSISELGLSAASGEAIPADHPLAQAEASPFNFSSAFTGASGGGGCPADVTVMGVTVPLSNTCEGLNALGLAALGISLIWAARVVFGG